MKADKVMLISKIALLTLVILGTFIASILGLAGCEGDKDSTNVDNAMIDIEDGKYIIEGLRSAIPMHPENFGDTLVVERANDIFFVTIEILDNTKVERLYWKGRKKTRDEDSIKVIEGKVTKYMFAFDAENIGKTLTFQIGGGRMPLDPPLEFEIDFEKAKLVSNTVDNVTRPAVFLDK